MTYRWYINITQCKGASKKETWWRSRKIWWIHPYVDVYLVGHSPRLSLRKPRYHRWLHLRYFRDGVAFRVGQAYVEWWFISKPTLLHFIIQKTILSAYLSQVPCSYLCWDMLSFLHYYGQDSMSCRSASLRTLNPLHPRENDSPKLIWSKYTNK